MIELLAEADIFIPARDLQEQVDRTHRMLRIEGPGAAQGDIDKTDRMRMALIAKFKEDLRVRPPRKSA